MNNTAISTLSNWNIVDLTQTLTPDIPVWPQGLRFEKTIAFDYAEAGCRVAHYKLGAGIGTHMDAPAHFVPGTKTMEAMPIEQCVGPGCIIDVRKAVHNNADYTISKEDISAWEAEHGAIPQGAIVLGLTGWSKHWEDEAAYRGMQADTEAMHFPGFSKAAAEYLVERKVHAVGIDTLSLDAGLATTSPVHHTLLPAGILQIENLCHVEALPPSGSLIFALPMKISEGPEAAARVIGMMAK